MGDYRRDPVAALRGMRNLTLEERGLYNGILDMTYAAGGPIRYDVRHIARVLGLDIRAVRRVLDCLLRRSRLTVMNGFLVDGKSIETLETSALKNDFSEKSGDNPMNLNDVAELTAMIQAEASIIEQSPEIDRREVASQVIEIPTQRARPRALATRMGDTGNLFLDLESEPNPVARETGVDLVMARVQSIWGIVPRAVREARKWPPPARLGREIKKCAEEVGVPALEIADAMLACYRSPRTSDKDWQYAPHPSAMVSDGKNRWVDWLGEPTTSLEDERPPANVSVLPRYVTGEDGHRYLIPSWFPDMQAAHLPIALRAQLSWVEDWTSAQIWRPERGPKPGEHGCQMWPSVAERHGIKLAEEAA